MMKNVKTFRVIVAGKVKYIPVKTATEPVESVAKSDVTNTLTNPNQNNKFTNQPVATDCSAVRSVQKNKNILHQKKL